MVKSKTSIKKINMKPPRHNQRYKYVGPRRIEELLPIYWDLNLKDYVADYSYKNNTTEEGDIRLRNLPIKLRLIFTVYWLDAEVQNGSFDQYFHNSTGSMKDIIVEDLNYLGAKGISKITASAICCFEEYDDNKYSESKYEELISAHTDNYHDIYEKENLQDMLIKFIQNNIEYFKNIELELSE